MVKQFDSSNCDMAMATDIAFHLDWGLYLYLYSK
jgi:hypothetical protein